MTIAHSGSATAGFISLEAGPGQGPVIDGTGLKVPTGQYGLVTINNASFIRLVGFELRNYRSSSAALVPIGVYVEGAGSHIEILSNHIHNIATTVTTSAGDALGIAVYGTTAPTAISWVTINGNELDDLTTGFSESLSLSGNVQYFEITDNLIHDNDNIGVNVEGFFHTAPDGYDLARDGLVAGNTVYNITSVHNPAYGDTPGADGIYVDGGEFVTVQQNLVHNADIGIEMASENQGKTTNQVLTRDNVVYHSLVTGIPIGGASDAKNGGTTNCVIANNTLFDSDTSQSGSGEFQIQFNAADNLFYNNILYANAQGLLVNAFAAGSSAPATLNHNLYYSPAGRGGSQWIWLGRTYTGLSTYKAKTNEDAKCLFANPQFVNAASFNFQPASTSPAISLGQDLGVADIGLTDEAGNPRTMASTVDAGAYEH